MLTGYQSAAPLECTPPSTVGSPSYPAGILIHNFRGTEVQFLVAPFTKGMVSEFF
jgi:hypothetical protein